MNIMRLTNKQKLNKALLCLCNYCNGFGIIRATEDICIGGEPSIVYEDCFKCKGTGFYKKWWKIKRLSAKNFLKFYYAHNSHDIDKKQINLLSKKSLIILYEKRKLSIEKISKLIGISSSSIRSRFNLYGIKAKNKKVDDIKLINQLRKYIKEYGKMPFDSKTIERLNNFPYCYITYVKHFGYMDDILKKCGIKKIKIGNKYKFTVMK